MKKFLSIMSNELKNFLQDKGALLIMIIGVVAYSLFYLLPYSKEVIKDIPVGIVNFDQTKFSRDFLRNIDTSDVMYRQGEYSSLEDAQKEFYKDKIKGIVVIPKDFEKDILKGKQANISVYADSAYLIVYKTIYSTIMQIAIETGAKIEVAKLVKSGMPLKQAIALKEPFKFIQIALFNPANGYKTYVYPIILILILHQTYILGLCLIQGTRNELKEKFCEDEKDIGITLFARATTYILLYLFYGAIIFLIYPALFVYPIYYNILPMALMFILMMYSAGFFAFTVSYFFKTRESSMIFLVPLSIVFIFLTGLIWPREAMPVLINIASFFIPSTCGVDGLIKINQNGAGFFNVLYDYIWLLFLSAFYFATSLLLLKKQYKEN